MGDINKESDSSKKPESASVTISGGPEGLESSKVDIRDAFAKFKNELRAMFVGMLPESERKNVKAN